MKEKLLKNRKLVDTIILILVGCFLCIPLLSSNTNVYADDGIQHIARAFGTLNSIAEDGLYPNIISSFSNNFGYSWNLFYGPFSTYGIIIVNFIIRNFIISYKIFALICLIISGIFMHKFALKLTTNNNASLLISILYMSFPYHLTDLYSRNAIGEFTSFIFIPLVFLGLYNLFYTEDNNYHLAIGAIGLILTHNISTILVAIVCLVYIIFNLEKIKETRIKKGLIINGLFIVLVTSFFWIPAIETKLSSDYRVYENEAMSTPESTANSGLKLNQLFVTQNDGSYIFELGPHIIIMIALSIMGFRKVKSELKENYVIFLVLGLITLWMSTKYFPWKYLPYEVCIIQFPWRMLMLSGFFFSLVCGINIYTIVKKFNYKDVLVISLIAVGYSFVFLLFIPKGNVTDIDKLVLGEFSGKEREVIAGAGKGEYLPSRAYEDRFYIATREDKICILEGNAEIENESKFGKKLSANIKTFESDYTAFELPYIYYPGYEVRIDGMITETFETENGFLGFIMGKEDSAEITVKYTGTKAMKVSLLISFISLIVFSTYVWKKH